MDQAVERSGRDPVAVAREIIDANLYMTLATADGDGRPAPGGPARLTPPACAATGVLARR